MDNAMKAGVTNDDVLSLIDNNSDAALKNGSKFTEPTLKEPDKPGGQPKCKPGKTNSRGSLREDEAAVKLTQSRYNTIQLPEVDGGNGKGIKKGTNPDLLIEGEVFDCYSPETSSVGNIYKVVQDKSTTQASRVVLNLEDFKGSVDDLVKCFYDNPIPTLDELLIINKDQVLCIYIK
jgi:hypothetical protein